MRTLPTVFLALLVIASPLVAQGGRQLFERYGFGWTRAGGYGTSIATIGDINGDGIAEIAAGDPSVLGSAGTTGGTGLVEVLSGLDGSVLLSLLPASVDAELGKEVAAVGDLNGDLIPDVAAGSRTHVVVFSGANGTELLRIAFGVTNLVGVGDWDNDQIPDLGALWSGVVLVFSGASGSPFFSISGPTFEGIAAVASTAPGTNHLVTRHSSFVQSFDSARQLLWWKSGYSTIDDAGDLDGDQRGDVIAQAVGGGMEVLSGLDGSVLLTLPAGTVASGGVDLDGDGTPDFAMGDGAGVRAYSGATGSLLFERASQEPGEALGFEVAMHPGASATTRPAVLATALGKFNGSVDAGAVSAIAVAAPGERDGTFLAFGQPCVVPVSMRPTPGLPTIGQTYCVRFDSNAFPPSIAFLLVGISNTTWAGQALPLQLPPTMVCSLYVSVDLVLPNGSPSFGCLNIPFSTFLLGAEIHVQGFSDFASVTNAATITIGN